MRGIHHKGGIKGVILLYINNIKVGYRRYEDIPMRKEIINEWKELFLFNANSIWELRIIPDDVIYSDDTLINSNNLLRENIISKRTIKRRRTKLTIKEGQ